MLSVSRHLLSAFRPNSRTTHTWGQNNGTTLAAAILHNCGLYVGHSAHHKHSYYLIRNGELLGYTETEIEIIANLARHRKTLPKKKAYATCPAKVPAASQPAECFATIGCRSTSGSR